MKTSKRYYSLIQYCPDLERLEAANVGVLLFCLQTSELPHLIDEIRRTGKDFVDTTG